MAKFTFDLTLTAKPQPGIPEESWTESDIIVEAPTQDMALNVAKQEFLRMSDVEARFLPMIQVLRAEKLAN